MVGWGAIGKVGLSFLQVAWKPMLIGAVGIAAAHFIWYGPRIDNLKLKLELEKQQTSRLESVIESQNTAIENASRKSKEEFDEIIDRIEDTISERDSNTRDIIERIIEEGRPEGCTESTLYLLEQIENLQWSDEQ
jgi:hypothetical protein